MNETADKASEFTTRFCRNLVIFPSNINYQDRLVVVQEMVRPPGFEFPDRVVRSPGSPTVCYLIGRPMS